LLTKGNEKLVQFNLSAGNHTLHIAHKEKGTKLDQIFISNFSSPQDGQASINCGANASAIPTSFRLTTLSSSQIKIDWKDNSDNEIGFEIWRSEAPDLNYSLVHTTAADTETYTDSDNLKDGTQYYYKILAKGSTNSDFTSARSTITNSDADPDFRMFEPQYNGNISAIKWGNSSDGQNTQQKLYEYEYDPMNRLKFADYVERNNTTNTWNQKAGAFNVEGINYDLNGNIKHLKRYAYENQLRILDDMTYTYEDNNKSNRLQRVEEANNADVKEGFVDGNLTDTDYTYDKNGNLEVDHNKGIISIEYNHLNLPYLIDFGAKGKIRYIYDAAGIKLRKDVLDENGNVVDKTFYINGIQYKGATEATATLDFIQTEEGRAVPAENSTFSYEYFLKDHLGNVRASLKTEPEVVEFTATMEDDKIDKESEYFKNLESRQADAANAKNGTYSAYLNNASEFAKNRGIGPAIMLRVSPGDTVNASVYGKYADKTDNTEHVVDNIFTLLAAAFGLNAATSEAGLTANGMENALAGQAAITPDGSAPKAYLNYIFLDKNFNPGNTTTGFERLPSGALNNYQLLAKEIPIDKEGFLYIFVANESPYDQGVWFDDFTVEVTKSPVAAISDYYPFGMLQAGNSTNSSDPVGNKYLYNGKELQEDLGFNLYAYGLRFYDPILARFISVDPLAEKFPWWTTYQYTGNDPILFIDLDGAERARRVIGSSYVLTASDHHRTNTDGTVFIQEGTRSNNGPSKVAQWLKKVDAMQLGNGGSFPFGVLIDAEKGGGEDNGYRSDNTIHVPEEDLNNLDLAAGSMNKDQKLNKTKSEKNRILTEERNTGQSGKPSFNKDAKGGFENFGAGTSPKEPKTGSSNDTTYLGGGISETKNWKVIKAWVPVVVNGDTFNIPLPQEKIDEMNNNR
jgi:RHS repeat-associated protein